MQAAINRAINPFNVWADLVRGLSDRLTAQMDADGLLVEAPSVYAVEVANDLRGLIKQCEKIGVSLQRLRQQDPKAFDAFVRAMETS